MSFVVCDCADLAGGLGDLDDHECFLYTYDMGTIINIRKSTTLSRRFPVGFEEEVGSGDVRM